MAANRSTHNIDKTHCPKGHPYDDVNTIYDRNRHRKCRSCQSAWHAAWYAKNAEKIRARARAWREADPERARASSKLSTWKRRGIDWDLERHRDLLERQGGACAICGLTPAELHVDHDHSSGIVRGLLCAPCNTAIGSLQENEEIMRAAISYLSHFKEGCCG